MSYCDKCGAEIGYDDKFCTICGSARKSSNPIIAILLNVFIIWGLGYYYLGYKTVFGMPWYYLSIAHFSLGFLWGFTGEDIFLFIIFPITIFLAYDLYKKAARNESKG